MLTDVRNLVFGLLLLAAVYMGHFATIQGQHENVQCFMPLGLEKTR